MKNATVIFGPDVDRAIAILIDFANHDEIPNVITFLDRIQEKLVNTLEAFPEGGVVFQGDVHMLVVEHYVFLYEYHKDKNEVHVLDMISPGQDWR